jgi:hypothetical protein
MNPTDPNSPRIGRPEAPNCTCPYEYKGLGRLYGVSMGKGWVRMTDEPNCPDHGKDCSHA